ncbi:MAG: hypothetical protein H6Q13_2872, partial [Bacteroidetes bacterium]|nr:hypothetical protein [Bacteroidota bacterium]
MKKLFEFKQESLIMTIVIFVYAIIAGGSVGFLFEGTFWAMIGGVIAIIIIVAIIDSIVNEQNKKKRLLAKSNFETEMKYSDISDKIGDDKCTLYFDKESKSVLIASINTEKVTQYKINNFIKDYVAFANGSYCAVDATQRKALVVKNNGISKNFKEVDYSDKDSNKDIIDSNEIKPIFQEFIIKTNASSPIKPTFVLVEESFGYITFFKENSIDSFNYIAKGYIASKKGQKSSVNVKHIGTYVFI